RRAVSLHSAAVTNKPAIPAMERVAASARAEEDDPGEIPTPEDWIQKIAELLRTRGYGLSDGASLEDVLAAVVEALEGGDTRVAASVQAHAESPEHEAIKALWQALKAKGHDLPDGTPAIDVLKAALKALEGTDETADENPDEVPDELETTTSQNTEVLAMRVELQQAASDLAAMQAREREREVEELVQNQVKCLKLNPNDTVRMAAAYKLARGDPETFTAIMSTAGDVLPPQGRTAAPDWTDSKRRRVIRNSTTEFQADPQLCKQTTLDAYVALSLRDEGLPALTEQERVTLG
ncbi:MAG: phage protease, partial [Planctomycetes bacterium]|nr:phage protease [Planctomycetota bacterium]